VYVCASGTANIFQVKMFKKPKGRRPSTRKRDDATSPSDEDESTESAVITKRSKGKQVAEQNKDSFTAERAFSASGTAASLVKDTATRTIGIPHINKWCSLSTQTLDIDGGDSLAPTADTSINNIVQQREDGLLYKGAANYTQYVNKPAEKMTQSGAGKLLAGPVYSTILFLFAR
jgi:hypothetical protein